MGGNSATPLASDSPCLVWREIVVVKIRATLRQQQQQLDDLLVQVTPKSDAACWCVGGSSGDGWWLCPLYQVYVLAFYIVASAASFFYCDLRLWFRGCPVVLDIELSVSTRYHQTHVLQRVRRFVLQLVAAGGGVRHKFEN